MDSTFISNKSCYIHKYLCFTRCISGTNLQILQFTPIMRYQGRFTTSLPRVSPCINTSLCKHVCMWWGHHLYQPVLNIHSFSLNKEINQHYRCNTFLFLSVCSVLPLPASQLGVWVARGQERGEVLCSQPMPCSIASTSHVGPLPWGTPRRTEWGRWHATHGPLLSVPAPFWGGFYSSWPRGIPGWWSPAVPPRVSLTPSHAIGSCPWGSGVRATWVWQIIRAPAHPWECPAWCTVPACAPEQEQNPGSPSKQQGNTSLFCGQKDSDNPVQTTPLDKNANNFTHRRSSWKCLSFLEGERFGIWAVVN